MSVARIATRYAKALLDLAGERGEVETVHADMATIKSAMANRELLNMMKSPIIHADKKNAVVDALFKDKVGALTLAYLHLLINKGREPYLAEISAEFGHQYMILKQVTSVKITSAVVLSEEVLELVKQKIQQSGMARQNLAIETIINPDILGGFILEFDNQRYDASLAHKLEQLKADFSKNLYIKEF